MRQRGKFILFTIDEFKKWLFDQTFIRKINLIQNHHTFVPSYKNFTGSNHFDLLNNMENYHINEKKYSQIAQNITTFPDGIIAICRPINHQPAGIYGANQFGICIEHIGNFDENQDQINDIHKDIIVKLNALLCKTFKLTPNVNSIVYHAWYNLSTGKRDNDNAKLVDNYHKTCPGSQFFGGNSSATCEHNFIPLVSREMI